MEPPRFYHFVKASGLVSESALDEVLAELWSSSAHTAPAALPLDLKRFQRPTRLRNGAHHHISGTTTDDTPTDSTDASLEGESATQAHEGITEQDRLLANELVRRGLLNSWQATQLLDGRTKFSLGGYGILDSIGKGGYGYVFLAREGRSIRLQREQGPSDERLYAIKVLPQRRATPEQTARFLHEIDVQKGLSHPNLVRFIDSGRDGNVHYMVHEFVDGGDLRQLLQAEGRLPFDVAATIVFHIARGIHYLHEKGVVHRDVKPANVLLCSEGLAKLVDMGLTIPMLQTSATHVFSTENSVIERQIDKATGLSGKVAGTIDFMAPDQIRFPDEPEPAWDIYSLGCLFYLALTGSVPFPKGDVKQKFRAHLLAEAPDPRVFEQSIPFDLVRLLRSMLAKDPNQRIRTAAEIATQLRSWVSPLGLAEKLQFGDESPPASADEEAVGFRWVAPPKTPSLVNYIFRLFAGGSEKRR